MCFLCPQSVISIDHSRSCRHAWVPNILPLPFSYQHKPFKVQPTELFQLCTYVMLAIRVSWYLAWCLLCTNVMLAIRVSWYLAWCLLCTNVMLAIRVSWYLAWCLLCTNVMLAIRVSWYVAWRLLLTPADFSVACILWTYCDVEIGSLVNDSEALFFCLHHH